MFPSVFPDEQPRLIVIDNSIYHPVNSEGYSAAGFPPRKKTACRKDKERYEGSSGSIHKKIARELKEAITEGVLRQMDWEVFLISRAGDKFLLPKLVRVANAKKEAFEAHTLFTRNYASPDPFRRSFN